MSHWSERAACHDADPALFFLPRTEAHTRLAQTICAECPVQIACGAYALENGITDGIWGGLTEDDRAATHRKNRQGVAS